MDDQILTIFRTVGNLLFSEFGFGLFLILITASVLSVLVDFLKRAFMRSSSELPKSVEKDDSEYYDTDSYVDPWEIPDKNFDDL